MDDNISSSLHIFLVEDNEHDRMAFGRAFKKAGVSYKITEYVYADEAFERLRRDASDFDIVVSDYKLPGMNGLELCRKLIEIKLPLPIVMLTGTGSELLAVKAMKAGIDDYIIKDPYQGYLELLPIIILDVVKKHAGALARIRAEKALKNSQHYLEKLNDSLRDTVFTVKMPEREIEYVNAGVEVIFGYSPEKCIGKDTCFLYPDKQGFDDFGRKLQRTIAQGNDFLHTEQILKKSSGELFDSEITTTFLRENGEIIKVISIVRDITERKRMEDELRHARKAAESANHAKSNFLARMSHELRSPLNGILGYAQILTHHNRLTESQQSKIDIIQRSGEYLLSLIDNILEFSKIESRKIDVKRVSFNFHEFLKSIMNIIKVRAQQKSIVFRSELTPNLPAFVYGDETRLYQILMNLLGNAVKYTDKGHITLKVSEQGETDNSKTLRFEVKDTGCGIGLEEMSKIFRPFEQTSHQTPMQGVGLGLAISQSLLHLMGSQIWVRSTVGQGSMFWFDLEMPNVEEKVVIPVKQSQHIVGFKGEQRNVLIVDDNVENINVLNDMLAPLGFALAQAVDGHNALAQAVEFQPDLIFMDIKMPGIDGFETLRRIRQIPELKNVIVIAISASVSKQTQRKSVAAGFDAFLTKPVLIEPLFELMSELLQLEWIRKPSTQPVPSQIQLVSEMGHEKTVFVYPSASELRTLLELAERGMILEIRNWLDRIEQTDAKYAPFIAKIRQLSQNFNFQKIRELLKNIIGSNNET